MKNALLLARRVDGDMPLDRLAFLALLYLALPNVLFLLGWVSAPWSWFVASGVLVGFQRLWCVRSVTGHASTRLLWFGSIAAAVAWTVFGGAGHFFYANFDWLTRDAVLRDLVVYPWPVTYGTDHGEVLVLRCPLGYYLPAALLGKAADLSVADFALWVWTTFGVCLFLSLLPLSRQSLIRLILGLVVVVLFSGLDIVPILLAKHEWPVEDAHLEWWAGLYQYSSNTTLLFWVPNHALPSWLAGAMFLRHWRSLSFLMAAPLLMALLPFWSPFAWVGMGPFMCLLLVSAIRDGRWRVWRVLDWLPAILLLLFVLPYLLMDFGRIPGTRWVTPPDTWDQAMNYLVFVVFEFGLLAVLLWRLEPTPVLGMACLTLLALPLAGRLGPGNDLVMRTSIPALLVLCVAVLGIIRDCRFTEDPGRFILLALVLLVGAVTPLHEFRRAIRQPAKPFDPSRGLAEIRRPGEVYPPHYVARAGAMPIFRILRGTDGRVDVNAFDSTNAR